ncbi:hypothetical protein LQF12_08095 [Ruania suaedae]|uniref:hypothetical protein n=1 Tax=Ruania suaedae TaxID=2897774 RepID=UPI001E530A32|nr:hypothetical protein [Ruania suaedae]UFU04516.1 hypothetical protein LQF12_08095 [Ruania suaedae]
MVVHARALSPVAPERLAVEKIGVVRHSLRRAGAAALTCIGAVAADAATRPDAALTPAALVGYSVTIWVLFPVAMALAVVAGVAASRRAVLSFWSSSLLVAAATGGWIAWGVGNLEGSLYGALLATGALLAGLASGRPWPRQVRAVAVALIALTTAVVLAGAVPVFAA